MLCANRQLCSVIRQAAIYALIIALLVFASIGLAKSMYRLLANPSASWTQGILSSVSCENPGPNTVLTLTTESGPKSFYRYGIDCAEFEELKSMIGNEVEVAEYDGGFEVVVDAGNALVAVDPQRYITTGLLGGLMYFVLGISVYSLAKARQWIKPISALGQSEGKRIT